MTKSTPGGWNHSGQASEDQRIRTFHARQGRISPLTANTITELSPRLGISTSNDPIDLAQVFPELEDVVFEIGFGFGDATAQMALADPTTAIVAIDVHTRGVARLMRALDDQGSTNARVMQGDAVAVLMTRIVDQSLAGVRAYFPDPWPKKGHHKRRLVQPDFLNLVAQKLRQGGQLHLATDWDDYAEQMLEVVGASPAFDVGPGLIERPAWRPMTRYESFGIEKGHRVHDLVATKVA